MVSCENIHLDFSLTVVTNELLVLGIWNLVENRL